MTPERSSDLPSIDHERGVKATSSESFTVGWAKQWKACRTWVTVQGEDRLTSACVSPFWLSSSNTRWFTFPSWPQDCCDSYAVNGDTWASLGGNSPHVRPVSWSGNSFSPLPTEEFELRSFCSAYSYSVDHPTWIIVIWQQSNAKRLLECVHVHPWRCRARNLPVSQLYIWSQLLQILARFSETLF